MISLTDRRKVIALLVLAGAVSYISYSAADSLVHSPHEKALGKAKK